MPLSRTDRESEYVGGVRFKAWAAAERIASHRPGAHAANLRHLRSLRSLGGLTHHVAHPGSRHYERFPVNANEAEARRIARFFSIGRTPGLTAEPVATRSREHPRTLDLRPV